ncbi:bis(5'-nucleosyl)-tetraphosphatase (symmetrical) YqeK [Vallitalea pronyensis]|uniref:bis(5'-nucleosyl)-tetraphosphatase (symmetrical) n=2 Tax=Vallitalea pronyensis TaxID=1348613 RepID=A0A8J8SJQ3_9FIRM|nr:bis(5'-nucleosyl)-tetraphosphatase (symmetrical) YqeK [Vallitalea pronyensis]
MNTEAIIAIRKALQTSLKASRYTHTLGVEVTAIELARQHGANVYKAQIAALLHDCAKDMAHKKALAICKSYGVSLTKASQRNPDLVHAEVGAIVAKKIYRIEDDDVLCAIAYHTTGRPGMSLLEKIIYIADYIEPGRDKAPNLPKIRAVAKENLDDALRYIMKDTIRYLKKQDKYINPITIEAYAYYTKDDTR